MPANPQPKRTLPHPRRAARARRGVLLAAFAAACASPPPEAPTVPNATPSAPSANAPASAPPASATETSAAETAGETCGALGCRRFQSPAEAFEAVLAGGPLVVAVGETHALQGANVPSATRRFIDQLLPLLQGRASDIVLEIWVPNPSCRKKVAEVAERQKPVTEKQASSNQSDFVVLGKKSESLGIQPHVLRPPCDEYEKILAAGAGDLAQMLEMIARLTGDITEQILARNAKANVAKSVVLYGGAMHNDLSPREGREAWSFGPRLRTATSTRYVEVDLIVPEFIGDTDAWRAMPWYEHYDPERHGESTILFEPKPGSFAIVFPRTPAADPNATTDGASEAGGGSPSRGEPGAPGAATTPR